MKYYFNEKKGFSFNKFIVLLSFLIVSFQPSIALAKNPVTKAKKIYDLVVKVGPNANKIWKKRKIVYQKIRRKLKETKAKALEDKDFAKKGGAVGVLARLGAISPTGPQYFSGTSIQGKTYTKHNVIQKLYDNVPLNKRDPDFHGKCAECVTLTRALVYLERAGHDLKDSDWWFGKKAEEKAKTSLLVSISYVLRIETKGKKRQFDRPTCDSCRYVTEKLGIIDLVRDGQKDVILYLLKDFIL